MLQKERLGHGLQEHHLPHLYSLYFSLYSLLSVLKLHGLLDETY